MINVVKFDNSALIDLTSEISFASGQIENALLFGAKNIVTQVVERIRFQGESTGGLKLDTFSAKRDGRYSYDYAKKRRGLGLRVDFVDLTVTGELINDYKVLNTSSERATVGFEDNDSADIAEYQEAYYGDEIFDPSDEEVDETINELEKYILNLLP